MKYILINILLYIAFIQIIHCNNIESIDNKILGGEDAEDKQYPWHATIAIQKANKPILCGGSLISRQWILTSAQCIDNAEIFSIGLGKTNLDEYDTDKLFVSTTGIKHPEYNKLTLENDIGLIKLPKLIVYSYRINATRLPSRKLSTNWFEDKPVNLSGHGRDENEDISIDLISLNLQTTTLLRCADFYGKEYINKKLICSIATDDQGPCFNDTGDPLVIYEDDGYATQIGIFSYFHEEGCNLGYPSVYTRVGQYIDWISEQTDISINEDTNNSSNIIYVSKYVIFLLFILYNIQ